MPHSEQEIEHAEKLVAQRCETAVALFLDICESAPGRPVLWQSDNDPWSFRVTVVEGRWEMDDLELEIDGVEEFFEGEDLASRDGVDHVICSVLIPLAIDVALGEVPDRSPEEFLSEMENAIATFEE